MKIYQTCNKKVLRIDKIMFLESGALKQVQKIDKLSWVGPN